MFIDHDHGQPVDDPRHALAESLLLPEPGFCEVSAFHRAVISLTVPRLSDGQAAAVPEPDRLSPLCRAREPPEAEVASSPSEAEAAAAAGHSQAERHQAQAASLAVVPLADGCFWDLAAWMPLAQLPVSPACQQQQQLDETAQAMLDQPQEVHAPPAGNAAASLSDSSTPARAISLPCITLITLLLVAGSLLVSHLMLQNTTLCTASVRVCFWRLT